MPLLELVGGALLMGWILQTGRGRLGPPRLTDELRQTGRSSGLPLPYGTGARATASTVGGAGCSHPASCDVMAGEGTRPTAY